MYIEGTIEGRRFLFLIDTGSTISIVNTKKVEEALYKKIKKVYKNHSYH